MIKQIVRLQTYLQILVLAILLNSCTKSLNEKDVIAVSIEPQRYFLEQIVGDKFHVETILVSGSDPETFEPSLSQRMTIAKSKAFITIGNFPFEKALAENLLNDNPNILIANCAEGIDYIKGTHIHVNRNSESGYDEIDPHVWTSVKNATVLAKNMLNLVMEIDSQNADYYNQNYTKLKARLDSVDTIICAKLAKKKSDTFIVWHPSLSYFARDYNLNQISIGQEGKESTVEHIHDKIEQAKTSNAKVFFFQEEYDSRQASLVNNELATRLVYINPLSYNWEQQIILIADEVSE
jgi:zinc transport system substrate-binding protein